MDVDQLIADADQRVFGSFRQKLNGEYLPEPVSLGNFRTVIDFALQFKGWRYLWGGSVPSQAGFDCSGLVIYCYDRALGAGLDRTNAETLFNDSCTQISAEEARPGDLVFYYGTYGSLDHISHVAIYCGDGIVYCAGDPIGFYNVDDSVNIKGETAAYFYARLDVLNNGPEDPIADYSRFLFPLYDYGAYVAINADDPQITGASQRDAFENFINSGTRAGQVASYVFNVDVYRAYNPDLVAKYGDDLAAYYQDFIDTGMALGRMSSDWFDLNYYRANNPDLVAKYGDDLAAYYRDFETSGKAAGLAGCDMTDITLSTITMKGKARNATGSALSPDIRVVLRGETLKQGTDYIVLYTDSSGTVSSSAPSAAGSYTVSIIASGNYHGSKEVGTFTIYDVSGIVSPCNTYRIRSVADANFILDAAGTSPIDGSNISVWTDSHGSNQEFILEAAGDGCYVIHSCANTDLVLDVANASLFAGGNVQAWTRNDAINQRWVLIPVDGSTTATGSVLSQCFWIVSAYDSGLALDISGDVTADGTNVCIWTMDGSENQMWSLAVSGTTPLGNVDRYIRTCARHLSSAYRRPS